MTPPLNLPAPGRCQAIFVILTISHSHMFLVNSRLGHFSAPASPRDPLSLSYGVNLPSSLAVIHSNASGYSPHPPVSVYGTGGPSLSASRFSREHGYPRCRLARRLAVLSAFGSPLRPSTRNSVSARRFHFSVATSPDGPAAEY